MVVLLAISTLAAALVPPPEDRDDESSTTSSTTTTTTEPVAEAARTGKQSESKHISAEVSLGGRGARPERIEVSPGDQLSLLVSSPDPGEVSLPDFGLLQFAGPGSPAHFDLLLEEQGEHDVRFRSRGTIATIEVRRAQR